jgi:hypothetical protein
VVKTEPRRPWRKHDAPHAACRNEGRSFFRSAVYFGENHLAVPVELFGSVGVVVNLDGRCLPFVETQ